MEGWAIDVGTIDLDEESRGAVMALWIHLTFLSIVIVLDSELFIVTLSTRFGSRERRHKDAYTL